MRIRTKLSLVILGIHTLYMTNSFAVAPGLYLGINGGPATNGASTQEASTKANPNITTPVSPRSRQFGSSLILGYKMGTYASVEGGINYFSSINFDSKGVETCSSTDVQVRDFNVVGKGEIPLSVFSVFGKAGVALTYINTPGALSGATNGKCGKSQYQTKFVPTLSVGLGYDINQNWVTDLSWNRLFVGQVPGNMDFFALGIAYHFVDKYCGQFLCDD